MDISSIIKNLHPLETRVLLTFSDKDELTSEKLVKELNYKEGHANQAFSWLSGKRLLKETERVPHTYYEITDMGRELAKTGTVEERFIELLKTDGAKTLPEAAAALNIENKDIGSAFGQLSKDGILKMNAEKKAEYNPAAPIPERIKISSALIKKAAAQKDGLLDKSSLSEQEAECIAGLAKKEVLQIVRSKS